MRSLALFLLMVVPRRGSCCPGPAAFVSVSGDDNSNCTKEWPCASLPRGVACTVQNGSLSMAPGIYKPAANEGVVSVSLLQSISIVGAPGTVIQQHYFTINAINVQLVDLNISATRIRSRCNLTLHNVSMVGPGAESGVKHTGTLLAVGSSFTSFYPLDLTGDVQFRNCTLAYMVLFTVSGSALFSDTVGLLSNFDFEMQPHSIVDLRGLAVFSSQLYHLNFDISAPNTTSAVILMSGIELHNCPTNIAIGTANPGLRVDASGMRYRITETCSGCAWQLTAVTAITGEFNFVDTTWDAGFSLGQAGSTYGFGPNLSLDFSRSTWSTPTTSVTLRITSGVGAVVNFTDAVFQDSPSQVLFANCLGGVHDTLWDFTRTKFHNVSSGNVGVVDFYFSLYINPFEISRNRWVFKNVEFRNTSSASSGTVPWVACRGGGAVEFASPDPSVSFRDNELLFDGASFSNTQAAGCGGAVVVQLANATNTSVTFSNSHFSNSTSALAGGCVTVQLGGTANVLNISKSTFSRCHAGQDGGALWVFQGHAGSSTVWIESSSFDDCRSQGDGGAVYVSLDEDPVNMTVQSCYPNSANAGSFRQWSYSNFLHVSSSVFSRNSASCPFCSGGALALANGLVTLDSISVLNNSAGLFGHALFVGKGTANITLTNSVIVGGTTATSGHAPTLVQLDSSGPVHVSSTRVHATAAPSTLLLIGQGGKVTSNWSTNTLVCAPGSSLVNGSVPGPFFVAVRNVIAELPACQVNATLLEFSCDPCPSGTCSFVEGHSGATTAIDNGVCQACPLGADCTAGGAGLRSKKNYWGLLRVHDAVPALTLCPSGYCCTKESCTPFDTCAPTRRGILCGECVPGFTGTLASAECRRTEECGAKIWDKMFWPAFVILDVVAAFYLYRMPDPTARGIDRIAFFFFQVVGLISIVEPSEVLGVAAAAVLEAFNFKINIGSRSGGGGGICLFAGLDPIGLSLIQALQPLCVWLTLGITLVFNQVVRGVPWESRVFAILRLLLLTYSSLASVSLALLNCIDIGGDYRLFMQAGIVCPQTWQLAPLVFGLFFILPFGAAFALGHHLVRKQRISLVQFLAACLCPGPGLLWCLSQLQLRPVASLEFSLLLPTNSQYFDDSLLRSFLEGPYSETFPARYWEGVILLFRLSIALVNVFVQNPLSRSVTNFGICLLLLLSHSSLRPYRVRDDNILQTISFTAMVIVSVVNVHVATLYNLGQSNYASALLWVQAGVVAIVGLAVVVTFVLSKIPKAKNQPKEFILN
eukprot:TRINITY_DN81651_c0_g1_i1.p1 TRINITY_DN81651_c0_g1~~TRINITY_DN81651_c0_g1_i1.p1  ORF type:complete len:1268 (-),score=146.17 TRINITY_DN81651_c0_g1_i1:43-3846(-)